MAVWLPTVTVHHRLPPVPGTVTHVRMPPEGVAAVTRQPPAVYRVGSSGGPYTTTMRASLGSGAEAEAGPRCSPSMYTTCPPSVLALWPPGPLTLKGCGGRKEVVSAEGALLWPDTLTAQRCRTPTPTSPRHVTQVWATGSRLQFRATRTMPSTGDVNVTRRGVEPGPKLVPMRVTLEGHPVVPPGAG